MFKISDKLIKTAYNLFTNPNFQAMNYDKFTIIMFELDIPKGCSLLLLMYLGLNLFNTAVAKDGHVH